MDSPPQPGDPLAQPTRARLFELIVELRRPAATDELAESLGMHPNGIRLHLETLADAGLVARDRQRLSRGRPRDVWSLAAGARPSGSDPTGYADLSRWLLRSLVAKKTRVADVEEVGRKIGRELAADGAGDNAEEEMFGVLVALGFQPERTRPAEDRTHFCLRNCPYREAAQDRQQLVCGLHRGVTRGMLERIDPKLELSAFVAKDPVTAGCEIEIRGLDV